MLWGYVYITKHFKLERMFWMSSTHRLPSKIQIISTKKSTSAGINLLIHSPITTSLQIVSKLQTIHKITHQAVREPIRENISTSTKIKLSDNSISHKTL